MSTARNGRRGARDRSTLHARASQWVGRRGRRLALLGPLALLLASCGNDNQQNALDPKGPYARKADDLWDIVFIVAAIIGVLVFVALVVAIVKFRERPGNENPRQGHGNTVLEIGWTIAPAVLLAVLAVPSVKTIWDLAEDPKADALHVRVVGHQFWWEYQYLDSEPTEEHTPEVLFATANELVIPADRQVALYIESIDVIHSFWIPELAGKQDAVPGRSVRMLMQADDPDLTYLGQCAEFCGLSHANMRAVAQSLTAADFDAWVAEQMAPPVQSTDPAAQAGAQVFAELGCAACHQNEGFDPAGANVGPNLTHVASRDRYAGAIFDFMWGTPEGRDQLRQWIRNAPAEKEGSTMRNYEGQVTDEQLDQLVAYLESLA